MAGDEERALARQKAWATGLVALAALVYLSGKALEGRHPALAYVAAFAEASVIGALADWYAVVALFRHPLGLKLPHTAIIPANQERIAQNLGAFVATHFLVGARVGEKVLELDPAAATGRWLAGPDNRRLVAAHTARLLPRAIEAMDRDALRAEIERQHAILDELMGRVESLLVQPQTLGAIRERIRAELPTLFRYFQADMYVLQRLVSATHALLKEVREDGSHPLRAEFDRFVAEGLERFVGWLRADVEREHSIVRSGVEAFLGEIAGRLQHDTRLRLRLNCWLAERVSALTERYKGEVAGFVAAQVQSWDTRPAVRTIELSIGRDLQYIRVNGTLVGGLLGLAIFAFTRMAMS